MLALVARSHLDKGDPQVSFPPLDLFERACCRASWVLLVKAGADGAGGSLWSERQIHWEILVVSISKLKKHAAC